MRKRIVLSIRPLADPEGERPVTALAAAGDFDLNPQMPKRRNLTPAAVLVPLVERTEGLTVLLTRRTDHLHDHAGQISFPGGRMEEVDTGPVATALRETEEELHLDRSFVEVVGYLDTYETVTGYLITPVVGFVAPDFTLKPDRFEVADVFEVPLAFILDPANRRTGALQVGGRERSFYVFEYENRFIWGATAGMLVNLCRRVNDRRRQGVC